MREAQGGDQEAYRTLLEELRPVLHTFLSRRVHRTSEVDDILQEVLLGVHKARHTFDPERSFLGWMFSIARYKLIDYVRRHKRKYSKEIFDEELSERAGWYDDVSAITEDRQELTVAMQELPDRQREIVALLKVEGLSVRQVAEKTQLSESAVKVNAHRAYKKLKREIVRLRDEV